MLVKPYFIDIPESRPLLQNSTPYDKLLRTPNEFFAASHAAGIRKLILTSRDNILAHYVSNFEFAAATSSNAAVPSHFTPANFSFIKHIISYTKTLNNGFSAALSHGYVDPLIIDFAHTVTDLCGTVKQVIEYVGCSPNISLSLTPTFSCKPVIQQTEVSPEHSSKTTKFDKTLGARIGNQATAQAITLELTNTPYEWTLNLSVMKWPSDVPRPLEATPWVEDKDKDKDRTNIWGKLEDNMRV